LAASLGTVVSVRTPAELSDAFRLQGLKVTPQRQLLFRLLHGNDGHPSAEALFATASELMPGISLRTVYQTLNDLVAMGELQVVCFTPGSNRFDPNTVDHHHVECVSCGELRDVYVDPLDLSHVHGLDGFQTHRARIVFTGLCATCAAASSTPNPTPHHT
jgi:Fe2+ or Zn2+ uptake regulation protein